MSRREEKRREGERRDGSWLGGAKSRARTTGKHCIAADVVVMEPPRNVLRSTDLQVERFSSARKPTVTTTT